MRCPDHIKRGSTKLARPQIFIETKGSAFGRKVVKIKKDEQTKE